MSLVILLTDCVFASAPEIDFWKQRSASVHLSGTQLASILPAPSFPGLSVSPTRFAAALPWSPKTTQPVLSLIPSRFGSVRSVSGPGTRGTIIHIQDVHLNPEAQANIRGAIQALVPTGQIGLVAVEGGFQRLPLEDFRSYPHREALEAAARTLAEQRKISGALEAALTSLGSFPDVVGVDDQGYYHANVKAYLQSAPQQGAKLAEILSLEDVLRSEKKAVFGEDLLRFDAAVGAYHAGDRNFSEHLEDLDREVRRLGISEDRPNINLYLDALKLEAALVPERIELERRAFLEALINRLTSSDRQSLLLQGTELRLGNMTQSDFYHQLEGFCGRAHVDLSKYPAFASYLSYVFKADAINGERLLEESQLTEDRLYEALVRTPVERALLVESRGLSLAAKLTRFSLTPVEWQSYLRLKAEGFYYSGSLASFERFYRAAEHRNDLMAENLAREMDKRGAKEAVLVTGGFHAEGMRRILVAQGFSVIEFVPKIEKADPRDGSAYLGAFAQEKTPLEQLFQGEKLFVSPEAYTPAITADLAGFMIAVEAGMGRASQALASLRRFLARRVGDMVFVFQVFHRSILLVIRPESGAVVLSCSCLGLVIGNVREWIVPAVPGGVRRVGLFASVGELSPFIAGFTLVGVVIFLVTYVIWRMRYVEGWLYKADLVIPPQEPLDPSIIKKAPDPVAFARELLDRAAQKGYNIIFVTKFRVLDGPGSALDLDPYIRILSVVPTFVGRWLRSWVGSAGGWTRRATYLSEVPSTITLASNLTATFRIEPASDPNLIEYDSPIYGFKTFTEPVGVDEKGQTPKGMEDAVGYIFMNLFGLKGIKIVVEKTSRLVKAGGMESSNVDLQAFITMASMLSGAQLSEADIYALATKLENGAFRGITGGQGIVCSLLGRVFRHFWFLRENGQRDVFSIPVFLKHSKTLAVEDHMLLVQAGLQGNYTRRSGALINRMWMDILINDASSFPLFREMVVLTDRYAHALQRGDYKTVVKTINRYVDLRNSICRRWVNLMLDAHQGKPGPEWAKAFAQKVFTHPDPFYQSLRDQYEVYGDGLQESVPEGAHQLVVQAVGPDGGPIAIPGLSIEWDHASATSVGAGDTRAKNVGLYENIKGRPAFQSPLMTSQVPNGNLSVRLRSPLRTLPEGTVVRLTFRDREGRAIVNSQYMHRLGSLRDVSLYSLDPIGVLVHEGKAAGIAIMPLGAGGPGANLIAVSPYDIEHLERFLKKHGLKRINENHLGLTRKEQQLKGYIPFHVDDTGRTDYLSFEKLGLRPPKGPVRVRYDQWTGKFKELPPRDGDGDEGAMPEEVEGGRWPALMGLYDSLPGWWGKAGAPMIIESVLFKSVVSLAIIGYAGLALTLSPGTFLIMGIIRAFWHGYHGSQAWNGDRLKITAIWASLWGVTAVLASLGLIHFTPALFVLMVFAYDAVPHAVVNSFISPEARLARELAGAWEKELNGSGDLTALTIERDLESFSETLDIRTGLRKAPVRFRANVFAAALQRELDQRSLLHRLGPVRAAQLAERILPQNSGTSTADRFRSLKPNSLAVIPIDEAAGAAAAIRLAEEARQFGTQGRVVFVVTAGGAIETALKAAVAGASHIEIIPAIEPVLEDGGLRTLHLSILDKVLAHHRELQSSMSVELWTLKGLVVDPQGLSSDSPLKQAFFVLIDRSAAFPIGLARLVIFGAAMRLLSRQA